MYLNNYNIYKFLERVKDKNFHEIINDAQEEVYKAEQGSFRVKGAIKKRASGSLKYANDLKDFLFFMGHGIRPAGINDNLFLAFKSICENLVKKKQFKPDIMKIFNK